MKDESVAASVKAVTKAQRRVKETLYDLGIAISLALKEKRITAAQAATLRKQFKGA